jgi:hypothetical protein
LRGVLVQELEGGDNLKYLDVEGRKILNYTLKIAWEGLNWMCLDKGRKKWPELVNTAMIILAQKLYVS